MKIPIVIYTDNRIDYCRLDGNWRVGPLRRKQSAKMIFLQYHLKLECQKNDFHYFDCRINFNSYYNIVITPLIIIIVLLPLLFNLIILLPNKLL